jgi:hypothetical protein
MSESGRGEFSGKGSINLTARFRGNVCLQKHTKESEAIEMNCLMPGFMRNRWKSKGWRVFGIALILLL